MLLQQSGDLEIALEDSVMKACEPVLILSVEPVLFVLRAVKFLVLLGSSVELLEEVFDKIIVIRIAARMQHCRVLVVEYLAEIRLHGN